MYVFYTHTDEAPNILTNTNRHPLHLVGIGRELLHQSGTLQLFNSIVVFWRHHSSNDGCFYKGSTQQICQNFPIIQFFWNFYILFYGINSLQYENLKETDRHIFPPSGFKTYHFRPISGECKLKLSLS